MSSSISVVTRLRARRPSFDFWEGQGSSFFPTTSRPDLVSTQPPIQWLPGALSPGIKRQGREADQSLPSSTEVTKVWSYTSTPPIRLHGQLFPLPLSQAALKFKGSHVHGNLFLAQTQFSTPYSSASIVENNTITMIMIQERPCFGTGNNASKPQDENL
jgi:hypothetical protein